MFFKSKKHKNMWDTYLYFHGGRYYLYYLVSDPSNLYGVCLAISEDGVHWEDRGMILSKSKEARWMATGAIMKSPTFHLDGLFRMSISEWFGPKDDEGQQTLHTVESTNLIDWKVLGEEKRFFPAEKYYKRDCGNQSRWDGIAAIADPAGGYYGYWTANPKDFHPGFGFGHSDDGIVWTVYPPPKIDWGGQPSMNNIEVGDIEKIGSTYYMMIGTWGLEEYEGHTGMLTFTAKDISGPFLPATKNFNLLTSTGHLNAYFTRFCKTPDGVLVNHQSIPRKEDAYFGLLKVADVDQEGTLRLKYWNGNEKIKGRSLDVQVLSSPEVSAFKVGKLPQIFDPREGLVLEGDIEIPCSQNPNPPGFMIPCENDRNCYILIEKGGIVGFGFNSAPAGEMKIENRIDRDYSFDQFEKFRLFINKSMLEFYLGEILIQCYSLPDYACGKLSLIQNADEPKFFNLNAWTGADTSI